MEKMKLKTKLNIPFYILLGFIVIIGFTGLLGIYSVKQSNNKLINDFDYLSGLQKNLLDVKISNDKYIEAMENKKDIDTVESDRKTSINNFSNNLNERNNEFTNSLKSKLDSYANLTDINDLKKESFLLDNLALEIINESQKVNSLSSFNLESLIILALIVVSTILAFLITQLFTKNITSNIRKIFDATTSLSKGIINLDFEIKSNDECGAIASNIKEISFNMDNINNQLIRCSKEILTDGNPFVSLNENEFIGIYNEITKNSNVLINILYNDINTIIHCVDEYGKGNFEVKPPIYPGEKLEITKTIKKLRIKLKGINNKIGYTITCANEGKLSHRINSSIFSGEWFELVENVNNLVNSFAKPIEEVTDVIGYMARGDLSTRVTGDYEGIFWELKNSINFTLDELEKYIKDIARVLNEISNKNLNINMDTEYVGDFISIKQSQLKIIQNLNNILSEVNNSADQISYGAKNIADSSIVSYENSIKQSEIVDAVVNSVISIKSETENNAQSAQDANKQAIDTKEKASVGNIEMQEMLRAMEEINDASNNISKIIQVIDEIAFQTNLLALNAAVEAARAGQHGKGFAVVAEEVRNLSSRTTSAAMETTQLIKGSIDKVNEGTEIANKTAHTLREIVDQVTNISTLVSKVADASEEQSYSINEINDSISQISVFVQHNKSASEEEVAKLQELSSHAETFKSLVSGFKFNAVTKIQEDYNIKSNLYNIPTQKPPTANGTFKEDNALNKYGMDKITAQKPQFNAVQKRATENIDEKPYGKQFSANEKKETERSVSHLVSLNPEIIESSKNISNPVDEENFFDYNFENKDFGKY